VIVFLFVQRAAIYSTMLVAIIGTGINIYLQRSAAERQSSQETEAVSTETSGVHESLAD
jgi:multisubunit Na+/H+ antiporter MnhC subunit